MDNETLRKLQLVELEIANEIKRVCVENNIKYFLESGTLLGAVRHGGFIPWDDDMDIGMMREEYEKFLKIAPEKLSSKFILQTWKNERDYSLTFAKVRKLDTIFLEYEFKYSSMHNGIWVDIFPYDSVPEKKILLNLNQFERHIYCAAMSMKCNIKPWKLLGSKWKSFKHELKHIPLIPIVKLYSKEKLINKYECVMKRYNNLNTQNISSPSGKWIVPRKCGEELSEMMFEGIMFSVPADSDLYLKSVYGDYMTLPPKDKQVSNHNIIKIKL